jgi:hypothetical protein
MTAPHDVGSTRAPLVEVGRGDIDQAVAAGVIEADQADALWNF